VQKYCGKLSSCAIMHISYTFLNAFIRLGQILCGKIGVSKGTFLCEHFQIMFNSCFKKLE
jgi:hypothetical protein